MEERKEKRDNSVILEEIKKSLPLDAKISEICFEGSEIVLYTKSEAFLKNSFDVIKNIVTTMKKRIEVRADPSMIENEEKTDKLIHELVPEESGLTEIYFEPEFSKVILHAKKPGLVIGKSGEIVRKIIEKTNWTPIVKRSCAIDSEMVVAIRKMLHKDAGNRKKFLHDLGKKIYSPMTEVEWIKITALGGFREVGRSCILMKTPQTSLLMDCGISIGGPKPFPHLEIPEFVIQNLDAVIISHAHLDHAALVPYLYEYGYTGPVYMTEPTRDLFALLCMDYIDVCQREHKDSPYTTKGIEKAIKHSVALDYGTVSDIAPDVRLTLENSGHMLGSSLTHLNIGNGTYNLLYTGDLKYGTTKLFDPARTNFTRVEGMIIESTYGAGGDIPPQRKDSEDALIDVIKRTAQRGGKVLIPSFAAERGQEIATIVATTNQEELNIPIYLDGMLWDATAIHTAYPEFLSRPMQTRILHKGENPFLDPRVKGIGSQKEREEVLNEARPAVIISTSGMMNGGPVLSYLERMGEDPKNTLAFVGYQGEGTTGRRIQKGWKTVQINNRTFELALEVVTIEGLSGHSPQKELLNFTDHLRTKPKKILIDHGESSKCVELARVMHQVFGSETVAMKNMETIRLK